jgi:hypothetical protein
MNRKTGSPTFIARYQSNRRKPMDKQKQSTPAKRAQASREPHSLQILERGIHTGADYASFLSALIADITSGRITPSVGNAACNAAKKHWQPTPPSSSRG